VSFLLIIITRPFIGFAWKWEEALFDMQLPRDYSITTLIIFGADITTFFITSFRQNYRNAI
jgi:hypothetical protein